MNIMTLPNFPLVADGKISLLFCELGLNNYHAAAHHVWKLPYGRNSNRADFSLVLKESRGTCSTKHALLAELAREHNQPVTLMLGIYEMNEHNTPGIGAVLKQHELDCVPEAHCYLFYRGTRVDLTRMPKAGEPIKTFLLEEKIAPQQIGEYKAALHQKFIREWARVHGLSFAEIWLAREQCIAALAS